MAQRDTNQLTVLSKDQHKFIMTEWVPRMLASNSQMTAIEAYRRAAIEYHWLSIARETDPLGRTDPTYKVLFAPGFVLKYDNATEEIFKRPG